MMRFLEMGGYGGFVWSAYATSIVALIATVGLTLSAYHRTAARFRRMHEEDDG